MLNYEGSWIGCQNSIRDLVQNRATMALCVPEDLWRVVQFSEDQIELKRRSEALGIVQILRDSGRPNGENETLGIKKQTLDLKQKHRTASGKPGNLRNRVLARK